jgi:2-polyprenyl-6-methoxyphenol hydroxylase-like FAD-dependent oxidoreductase
VIVCGMTDVIVVGAGPTGLMLACELALAGVRCKILERRADQPNITRAFAVHARTLELLDARGIDLTPVGLPIREINPAPGVVVRLSELDTRYPMLRIVPQSRTEHVLEARARELGVEIVYGAEVTGLRQGPGGVTLDLRSGESMRAGYVVGCDGAHSTIRSLIGVDFVGRQYETHILLADVALERPPSDSLFAETNEHGAVIFVPFGDGTFRAIAWDRTREDVPLSTPVTGDEMRAAFRRIAGDDHGMSEPTWSSRFLSERRQARHYRVGRVFLAGDAAHVHSPLGGQGMNTGIQDAFNLGWKLAAAVHGRAPEWLLASSEQERHPVGAQVLRLTDGFNQLVLGRTKIRQFFQILAIRTIVKFRRTRRALIGRLSGIGIRYPRRSRSDHPLVGRRMPDVEVGPRRLYELLRDGRFVIVPGALAGGGLAKPTGPSRGGDPTVLVRPDGYVAWAGPASAVAAAVDAWGADCTVQTVH